MVRAADIQSDPFVGWSTPSGSSDVTGTMSMPSSIAA